MSRNRETPYRDVVMGKPMIGHFRYAPESNSILTEIQDMKDTHQYSVQIVRINPETLRLWRDENEPFNADIKVLRPGNKKVDALERLTQAELSDLARLPGNKKRTEFQFNPIHEIDLVSSEVNGTGEIGSFRLYDAIPMLRIGSGDDYDYYGVIKSGNQPSWFGRTRRAPTRPEPEIDDWVILEKDEESDRVKKKGGRRRASRATKKWRKRSTKKKRTSYFDRY